MVVANLANNHAAGVGFSAVPPNLKWGVILACTHFGRFRGSDAVSFIGPSGARKESRSTMMDALQQAREIWDEYKIRS